MKRIFLGLMLATAFADAAPPAVLAVGDLLPPLEGEFLTGRRVMLPRDAAGRVTLLILGFTYDARTAVEAWAGRFRKDFGEDQRVAFFEVPMIGGLARLGKWFIDNGMRKGTPPADYEKVITVYGGVAPWKQRVEFGDRRAAYLILIDPRGKVVWRDAGSLDEQRYRGLSREVRSLLGPPPDLR
jgi:hypothetical protein